jgi:hypothetical protein
MVQRFPIRSRLLALAALVTVIAACLAGLNRRSAFAAVPSPNTRLPGSNLRTYTSPIYTVYTDVAEDDAREAVIRMNKVAFEYHERTKSLFAGTINQPLPFYLFNKDEDYFTAGGLPRSAGVFTGDTLMARVIRTREGRIGNATWKVVQHEGFHQFVHAVIRGEIPTWVNEGLAEYFGEGVFTGDGVVTGCIPSFRLKRVQQGIIEKHFIPLTKMMAMSHAEWNADLDVTNYDQAWSMVHFLAQGDGGKYQDAFARYLQLVGRGNPSERAWNAAFGSVEGFEGKWKEFWTKMPDNPTIDLYAQAAVSTLTSFLGRCYAQKQTFDGFDEFIKNDAKDLKAAPGDWLPPALYTEMKELASQIQSRSGGKFSFTHAGKSPLPQIVCVMEDGTRVTGTFGLGNGGRIGKVSTEIVRKPASAPVSASPANRSK